MEKSLTEPVVKWRDIMDVFNASALWLVLCIGVMLYADRKGRSAVGFFFLSLLLSPLLGFVLVAASRPNHEKMGLRKCPQCAEFVKNEALKCRFCGFDFTASPLTTPR